MINEEIIATISQKMERMQNKVPELQNGDKLLRQMLSRILRPFILALVENHESFLNKQTVSPEEIIFTVLDILHQKGVSIPEDVQRLLKERYKNETISHQKIDWLKEVTYTTLKYAHPLTNIRKIVLDNLSQEGQIVSAREALHAIS